MLEVAERKLAEGAVDGSAEAEAGEIGLGDTSPEAVPAIDGNDMVIVVDGFEIHEQRRMAVDAQGGGGEQRAFKAVALALAQDALRRPGCVGVLIVKGVNELLDLRRSLEGAQDTEALRREAKGRVAVAQGSALRRWRVLEGQGGDSLSCIVREVWWSPGSSSQNPGHPKFKGRRQNDADAALDG